MPRCDICQLECIESRHYECNQEIEAGRTVLAVRGEMQARWRATDDAIVDRRASANETMGVVLLVFAIIAGAILGFNTQKDFDVACLFAGFGSAFGAVLAGASLARRRLESATARRIDQMYRNGQKP